MSSVRNSNPGGRLEGLVARCCVCDTQWPCRKSKCRQCGFFFCKDKCGIEYSALEDLVRNPTCNTCHVRQQKRSFQPKTSEYSLPTNAALSSSDS